MFTSAINTVKTYATDAAAKAYATVSQGIDTAGRKVVALTDAVLGETGGKIARSVAKSLPMAVAYSYAPAYVKGLALAAYLGAHVVYDLAKKSELPLSKNLYSMITTAVGVSHLYYAVREAMKAYAKQAFNPVVASLVHVGIASFMTRKAINAPVPTFGSYGVAPSNTVGETPRTAEEAGAVAAASK